MYVIFYKRNQILTSNTKSNQIARTFSWLFSWTFGLAYSPLNSAKLSCLSEVTLTKVPHRLQNVNISQAKLFELLIVTTKFLDFLKSFKM